MHDFVISCVDHLENMSSLRYANIDTFHYKMPKNHIPAQITSDLIRKGFMYLDAVTLTMVHTCVLKFKMREFPGGPVVRTLYFHC